MTSLLSMETAADPGNSCSQQCSSCDGSSARCWCLDCNEALCNVCVSAHRRVTLTRSHRILNQPPAGAVSTPPTKFCRLHPSETLKLFCFTCNQLTCRDCQLMTHMNHRYQFVSEALDSLKKQLEVLVQPIGAHGGTARQTLLDMETRLQDLVDSESNLKNELQQSCYAISQHLKMRMEEIMKEAKKVCELECEMIKKRMMKLKQLQQKKQSVTETAEKARNTNDLSALLTFTAQIESQLKDLPDQNSSPPPTMSRLKVVTDRKSLEAILNFGQLEVSWIPFSVSQTSNQNRDSRAAASSSSSSSLSPLTLTRPAPYSRSVPLTRTTSDTDSPVPVNCSSTTSKSSFSPLCPSPSSSSSFSRSCSTSIAFASSNSSATPPTSTCLSISYGTLPQTRNTCDTDSPVLVNGPSTSWKPLSNQFCPPPSSRSSANQSSAPVTTTPAVTSHKPVECPSSSTVKTLSHLGTNPRQLLLPRNHVQHVSTSVKLQPVGFGVPPKAGASPSCTVFKLVKPSLVLNRPTAPHQNQPAAVLLTNNQTAYQVSCWPSSLSSVVPQFPMLLSQTVSYTLPGNTRPKQQVNSGSRKILPAAPTQNQIPVRPSQTALPSHESDHQPLKDIIYTTITSGPVSSPEGLTSAVGSHSSSPKHQQLCLPPSSSCSSSVTPPTSTCPAPTCRPLPLTENTSDAASPVPDDHLTTSRETLYDQMCPSSSTVTPPAFTCLSPSCGTFPQTGNTCDTDSPVPVNGPSTSWKSSSNQLSPPPSSCPSVNRSSAPVTTAVTSDPLFSFEGLISDVSPHSSSLKQPQQSPVVRAVADSACDLSVQQVAARQQEHAENEPTSTVSEETEPAGKLSPPEVSDGDAEEPSSVIGYPDCSLSQWQPRVSLFRLPVSPPRPGRPLSGFRLVPGDSKDEIYLEEITEDIQSRVDDVTGDITEPPSSPGSPVTLQIVTCSACGAANGSIICSACGRGYHRDCHVPPVGHGIWSEWICSLCQDLSDPSDPYSSDRPQRPQSPCLSLLDQRFGVWSHLKLMSDRLTLRRPPAYQTAAELLSDIWSLFNDVSQDDDVLNKLQESFQIREMETFSSELNPSVPMPPSSSRNTEGDRSAVGRPRRPLDTEASGGDTVVEGSKRSKVTSEEQEVITSKSKLKTTRKRLREFLDLVGTPGSKRTKTESRV
ncbi:mucin-5AC isoform X2 [Siniperca chuatsi]|uniref:mucin-5AC isoform X2 n=1 Tax=Siniperca chuatsi TaxID=119488 RepID=UPI001CE1847B|nr:mucin-5AC isoform X2 [Siniperca chuatsi]